MQQVNIGKWWGLFKLLGQNITSYVQYINMVLIALTAYATTISPYLHEHGIAIPIWAFGVVILTVLIIAFVFEWAVSFPSFFSVWNSQWWNHNNPMKAEVEKLHKEIAELKTLITSMQKDKQ
jgi:hypothetical protein